MMSQMWLIIVMASWSTMGTSIAKVGFPGVSQVVVDVLVAVLMALVASVDAV
jgi:hypothetical protein